MLGNTRTNYFKYIKILFGDFKAQLSKELEIKKDIQKNTLSEIYITFKSEIRGYQTQSPCLKKKGQLEKCDVLVSYVSYNGY